MGGFTTNQLDSYPTQQPAKNAYVEHSKRTVRYGWLAQNEEAAHLIYGKIENEFSLCCELLSQLGFSPLLVSKPILKSALHKRFAYIKIAPTQRRWSYFSV